MPDDFPRATQWPPVDPPKYLCENTSTIQSLVSHCWPYTKTRQINRKHVKRLLENLKEELAMTLPSPSTGFYYLSAVYALLTDKRIFPAVPLDRHLVLYPFTILLSRITLTTDVKLTLVKAEIKYASEMATALIQIAKHSPDCMTASLFHDMDDWHRRIIAAIEQTEIHQIKKRKVSEIEWGTEQVSVAAKYTERARMMERFVMSWLTMLKHVLSHSSDRLTLTRRMFRNQLRLANLSQTFQYFGDSMRNDKLKSETNRLFQPLIDAWAEEMKDEDSDANENKRPVPCDKDAHAEHCARINDWINQIDLRCPYEESKSVAASAPVSVSKTTTAALVKDTVQRKRLRPGVSSAAPVLDLTNDQDSQEADCSTSTLTLEPASGLAPCRPLPANVMQEWVQKFQCPQTPMLDWSKTHPLSGLPDRTEQFIKHLRVTYTEEKIHVVSSPEEECLYHICRWYLCYTGPHNAESCDSIIQARVFPVWPEMWRFVLVTAWKSLASAKYEMLELCMTILRVFTLDIRRMSYSVASYVEYSQRAMDIAFAFTFVDESKNESGPCSDDSTRHAAWMSLMEITCRPLFKDYAKLCARKSIVVDGWTQWYWHMIKVPVDDTQVSLSAEDFMMETLPDLMKRKVSSFARFWKTQERFHQFKQRMGSVKTPLWAECVIRVSNTVNIRHLHDTMESRLLTAWLDHGELYRVPILRITHAEYNVKVDDKSKKIRDWIVADVVTDTGVKRGLVLPADNYDEFSTPETVVVRRSL